MIMLLASIYKRCCILLVASLIANVILGQPKSNKPNTQTQAASADSVNPVPAGYIIGGQNPKVNYVRTKVAMGPITSDSTFNVATYIDVKEMTTYIDGLGRPLQTVNKQATTGTTSNDLVTTIVYDEFGREAFKYLPYVSDSSNGKFKLNPFSEQAGFYQNAALNPGFTGEQVYYNKTDFDASPLNRINKIMAPGNSWAGSGRGVTSKNLINTTLDSVRIWTITNNTLTYTSADTAANIPATSISYSAGQLYKNVNIDETGNAVVEYQDKEGQVVLKKVQIGTIAADYSGYSGFLCTYYMYDDLNRLRFVVQPKAVDEMRGGWTFTTSIINELCFRYEYDSRQRMIAKKIPGAGWVYMVYDKRDRLVFKQDGNLKSSNKWLTTLYDLLDRPIMTGMISFSYNRDSLQNFVTGTTGSSSNIISSGTIPSSVSADLNLDTRETGKTFYQAASSITFNDGFESETSADFTAEIVGSGGSTNFSDTTSVYDSPLNSGNNFITLTLTYYDDYKWTSKTYSSTNNSKLTAGSNLHAVDMPSTASNVTIGMVTGTKVRVLEDASNLGNGPFLTTASFYDERNRTIQVNSDNYKGGTDIVTSRYDFTGKVLSSYTVLNNAEANQTNLRIKTNMEYDHAGRLIETWKAINDDTTKKALIAKSVYDALGQLKTKKVGRIKDDYGAYTSDPLETLDYTYNVRGWLTSINKDYANKSGTNSNNRWFGLELNYDWGFDSVQYNGNVTGTKWRSKGDGEKRAYGFGYDKTNRLLGGDFSQGDGSTYVDNANINFDTQMGDGQNGTSAYDANGNINRMLQWGLKVTSSSLMDSLGYTYQNSSNKLAKVNDGIATDNKLGDFKDGSNGLSDDYGYDVNGNIILDNNKAISSITYNHLNLPSVITVAGKGNVTYIYDAAGNKLRKRTVDSTASPVKSTTTDYVSGAVYENDVLQFIGQEEGRIRMKDSVFIYDYFIKDHLGNVRMVLTEEQKTNAYPACTMELADSSANNRYYSNVTNTRNSLPSGYPADTFYCNPNEYVSKVSGSGNKIGLAIVLKVMAGDKFNLHVSDWYKKNGSTPGTPNSPLIDLINALNGSIGTIPGNHAAATELAANSALNPGALSFFIAHNSADSITKPKAFVNWVLFDEQFKYDSTSSGFEQVGADNTSTVTSHTKTDMPVNKNGYLYIYVSNETPNIDLFFDNLQVTHIRGPLLEETHYYPFGLTMVGISSKSLNFGDPENKKEKFQGQEYNDDLGIDINEFKYRMDDPQIGRFWQIDPIAESYFYNSVYCFSENHVTSHVELEGLEKASINNLCLRCNTLPGTTIPSEKNQGTINLNKAVGNASPKSILKSSATMAGAMVIGGGGNPASDVSAGVVITIGALIATTLWIAYQLDNSGTGDEEAPSQDSQDGDKTEPLKGKRRTDQTDATKQLDQIEAIKAKASQDQPSIKDEGEWEGASKKPKQNQVESTNKSKQNEKKQFKEKFNQNNNNSNK